MDTETTCLNFESALVMLSHFMTQDNATIFLFFPSDIKLISSLSTVVTLCLLELLFGRLLLLFN